MNFDLIYANLRNPALLFFVLGFISVRLKSDLEVPPNSSKFISLYLLFSIGFKGGQELAHSPLDASIAWALLAGLVLAAAVPIYAFFLLKNQVGVSNAGAVAAAYGSVSAVTFVTAVSFLEMRGINFGGHMVAVMAFMEAPSIIVGVLLMAWWSDADEARPPISSILHHAVTNGSVVLILGSLLIGAATTDAQAQGIKPFTTDLFQGFLAVFLLDMGITSGRKIAALQAHGAFAFVFATVVPLVNGIVVAMLSSMWADQPGDRFLFAVLAASASYIAVPAAMRLAAPKADPGLYLPMALAITFPVNITFGMPIYLQVVSSFGL